MQTSYENYLQKSRDVKHGDKWQHSLHEEPLNHSRRTLGFRGIL